MEIIFLGTSAAFPTKYRSSSAIAVQISDEIVLFDCGEGTQVQFQKAGLRPGKLGRIFISHLHGDHFYGLIGFLTSLQLNAREKPLDIYGPAGLKKYIQLMQEMSKFSFGYEVTIHEVKEKEAKRSWEFENYNATALPLDHSVFTLGFRIEENARPGKFDIRKAKKLGIPEGPERARLTQGEDVVLDDGREIRPEQVVGPKRPGKKLAICLDTRPCNNAKKLAAGVDLLIHDGTFEADKPQLAQETGHSTVAQAATIAKEAGAGKLMLTHISQRYQKEDKLLLQSAQKIFSKTLLAQDLLQLEV